MFLSTFKKLSFGVAVFIITSTSTVFAMNLSNFGVDTGSFTKDLNIGGSNGDATSDNASDDTSDNTDSSSNGSTTEGDGNLMNETIEGDFNSDHDITLTNSEIKGDLTVTGTLTLLNSDVSGNITVNGNIVASNSDVEGYWLISGDAKITNCDFKKAIYVYGKANITNGDSAEKIKTVLKSELTNIDGGRIYLLGKGKKTNVDGKKLAGHPILTRVDPYLAIDLSEENFATLSGEADDMEIAIKAATATLKKEYAVWKKKKTRADANLPAIEAAKQAIIDAKEAFFKEAETMLTEEAVDKDGFEKEKKAEEKVTQRLLKKYTVK